MHCKCFYAVPCHAKINRVWVVHDIYACLLICITIWIFHGNILVAWYHFFFCECDQMNGLIYVRMLLMEILKLDKLTNSLHRLDRVIGATKPTNNMCNHTVFYRKTLIMLFVMLFYWCYPWSKLNECADREGGHHWLVIYLTCWTWACNRIPWGILHHELRWCGPVSLSRFRTGLHR